MTTCKRQKEKPLAIPTPSKAEISRANSVNGDFYHYCSTESAKKQEKQLLFDWILSSSEDLVLKIQTINGDKTKEDVLTAAEAGLFMQCTEQEGSDRLKMPFRR